MAKRPFEKSDRIASSGTLEGLKDLLQKHFYWKECRIEGGKVFNASGCLDHIGIFEETTRGMQRFWAYYKN